MKTDAPDFESFEQMADATFDFEHSSLQLHHNIHGGTKEP